MHERQVIQSSKDNICVTTLLPQHVLGAESSFIHIVSKFHSE